MPMHVIFLEPTFPANQREFVRALHGAGALVSGIGDRPLAYLDDQLKSWMYSYEHVPSSADVGAVTEAVKRIQARGPWVHKLECTVEALMLTAAEARERTGIPGMSVAHTDLCRDKYKMKQFLRSKGIPCAQSTEVGTMAESRAFVEKVGFPVIMKPISGAGAAGTYKITNADELVRAAQESTLDPRHPALLEEYVEGHEGFFDTLTVNGQVVFESISHYYPNVLEAMRTRDVSPIVIVTNRIDVPGYTALRDFGRQVVRALELETTATHMEWFYGPRGLYFSEIGARPPGVRVWDLYCAGNEFDLYREWANAIVHGHTEPRPSRRFTAGMVAIRPNKDGRVAGYSGVGDIQQRYGDAIIEMYLPPPGTRTNAVGSGYMGNAWVWARHPDYDVCKRILEDIGSTLRMWAE
jgi:carbamoylphosphate synthase large subunit